MKVGDLVRYAYAHWSDWYGIIVREIPGTDERRMVMWNRDNSVITSTPKRDLELVNEAR